MDIAYQYLVSGIIDSRIKVDGGQDCFDQIPANYKIIISIGSIIGNILVFRYLWKKQIQKAQKYPLRHSTLFQKTIAFISILTYLIQFYLKLSTKKGMFMLNPCHFHILATIYLLLSPTTKINRIVYIIWQAWLYGPILSLTMPHLDGIDQFEIVIYYLQHLLIIPIGAIILIYRYGFQFPSLKNQMLGFSTTVLYQYAVLTLVSHFSLVNLNFTLCQSPADIIAQKMGYTYLFYGQFYLNFGSLMVRLVMSPFQYILLIVFEKIKNESKQIKIN